MLKYSIIEKDTIHLTNNWYSEYKNSDARGKKISEIKKRKYIYECSKYDKLPYTNTFNNIDIKII